jgi:hypothetical protein
MMENDGYGKLGFFSNASIALGVVVGSIISTIFMDKLGTIDAMGLGALACTPYCFSLILPAYKS